MEQRRVGVVGGGQLGRMLALSGAPLGCSFLTLTPDRQAPAAAVSELLLADYDDERALSELAARSDVVTYEFENVPADAIQTVADAVPIWPPVEALRAASDRLHEKELFTRLGIPTVPYRPVGEEGPLAEAVAAVGLPAVLKTRRFGYDGKGQRMLREPKDVEGAAAGLGGGPLLLEGFVDFRRELSVIAVRGTGGDIRTYPLVENRHAAGVLRVSRCPVPVPAAVVRDAERYVAAILEDLNYVGVIALELFDLGDRLLANEIAPRVHNSGHLTIEGAETSQFENHLRAVLGLPLGSPAARGVSAMVNFIGEMPEAQAVLRIPGAHLHAYGKAPRPGRKVGHVTITAPDDETLNARLAML